MRAVKFYLSAEAQEYLSGRYDKKSPQKAQQIIDKACEIFNFTAAERREFHAQGAASIICSPEKFVEWLLWREQSGFLNRWRGLGVCFVEHPPFKGPLTLVEHCQ